MWEFLADYISDNQLVDGKEITVSIYRRDVCKVKAEIDDGDLDFKIIKIY